MDGRDRGELSDEPRLADSGLATHRDDRRFSIERQRQRIGERPELFVSTYERIVGARDCGVGPNPITGRLTELDASRAPRDSGNLYPSAPQLGQISTDSPFGDMQLPGESAHR